MTALAAVEDAYPSTPTAPDLDHALPGWAIDLVRDGIRGNDARKAWGAAVRVAMSAHRRRWTENQFVALVASTDSKLWAQLMAKRDGRRGSLPAAYKALRKAWAAAVERNSRLDYRDRAEIAADATEQAYLWADRLAADTDKLRPSLAAVMRYVVDQVEARGMFRVTCPGREVAEFAGISHPTAVKALAQLTERGLLVKFSPGRSGEPGKGRAAIYSLAVLEPGELQGLYIDDGEEPPMYNPPVGSADDDEDSTETHEDHANDGAEIERCENAQPSGEVPMYNPPRPANGLGVARHSGDTAPL